MKCRFTGYKSWKSVKKNLGFASFYILPNIEIFQDTNFTIEEGRTNIKFAWMFWEFNIWLKV